jgi:acetyltransferase
MPAIAVQAQPADFAATLPSPEAVTLRDGAQLTIRPIRPDDAPRLQALHATLSPETIRQRFLALMTALTDREAARLANVDYRSTMALVATSQAGGEEENIVGVARYAGLEPAMPEAAEAAIVIADRYQGRGLGRILYGRLIEYARASGFRVFVDEVNRDNDRMLHFLRSFGLPLTKQLHGDVWQVWTELEPGPNQT